MTIQRVPDPYHHFVIFFDHNDMTFRIKIDKGYKDSALTKKGVAETIEFWQDCHYTYLTNHHIVEEGA